MAYDKQKVIDIALAEVGYHEKASNSGLDSPTANSGGGNYTKYARDLDALGNFYNYPKNGYAWCDIFVDWCFVTAYGRAAAQKLLFQPNYSLGAGCLYSAQYYKQNNAFYSAPQTGDQIFFSYTSGEVSHTGIVVGVDDSYVVTVEGNSDDRVEKKIYYRGNKYIYGYGRPCYGTQAASTVDSEKPAQQPVTVVSTCTVKLPLLRQGDVSQAVRSMQTLLISRGYNCGKYGADGEFGAATAAALRKFQTAKSLVSDAECGEETWGKLISKN